MPTSCPPPRPWRSRPPPSDCEGPVNLPAPLARGRRGWPYISLPRGPTGSAGHPENRIPARTRGGADEASTRGIAGEERQLSTSFSKSDEQANETTSHPTGESTSTYRSDGSKVRTAPERGITRPVISFERRVRSWLRMNAGGAPNTCKSNGTPSSEGKRVANG